MKHPNQKVYIDLNNVARFRPNKIVQFLLDQGPFDLNKLSLMGFDYEDWSQFAQLIGYSVCGYSDLSYSIPAAVEQADEEVEILLTKIKNE